MPSFEKNQRWTIIGEYFNTITETKHVCVLKRTSDLTLVKLQAKRWMVTVSLTDNHIPTVCRIENSKEEVMATYDWIDGQPVVRK